MVEKAGFKGKFSELSVTDLEEWFLSLSESKLHQEKLTLLSPLTKYQVHHDLLHSKRQLLTIVGKPSITLLWENENEGRKMQNPL